MIRVSVKIDDQMVLRALDALINRGEGREYLRLQERVGEIYRRDIESRFESQTDPTGKRWRPNTPSTRCLKEYGGLRRGPARRGPDVVGSWTERLRESIRWEIDGDTIKVGSDVEHAAWFDQGTKGGWMPSPSRPFLGTSPDAKQQVLELLEKHFAPAQE